MMAKIMLTGDMVTPTFNFKDVFYALLSHGIVCFPVCNEIKFGAHFIILNYQQQQQQQQYYYLP